MKAALQKVNMKIISEKEVTYFRLNTLRWMLKEKLPLSRLVNVDTGSGPSEFRRSLERDGLTLGILLNIFVYVNVCHVGDDKSMAQFIPALQVEEVNRVHHELQESSNKLEEFFYVGRSFDGTSHVGECINDVIRFVYYNPITGNYSITQRLLAIRLYAEPCDSMNLAFILHGNSTGSGVALHRILSISHDRAKVNEAALRELMKCREYRFVSMPCVPHTIDNGGDGFDFMLLSSAIGHHHNLMRSLKAKEIFITIFGVSPASYSETRWWSAFTQWNQIFPNFGKYIQFVDQCISKNVCVESATVLKKYDLISRLKCFYMYYQNYREIDDPMFIVYLSVYIDIGLHFCNTTYELEGDSFLIILAFDKISSLLSLKQSWQHPRLTRIAQGIHDKQDPSTQNYNPQLKDELIAAGREGAIGAINYIEDRFTNVLDSTLFICIILFRCLGC